MKATRFFLTSGALALLGVAAPVGASAETHVGIGILLGGRYDSRDAFRYGLERGRAEGAEHGCNDARRGRDFNFWHDSGYRDGDRGYKHWMGPRWDYAAGYRRGYAMGYRQADGSPRAGCRGRNARSRADGPDHQDDPEPNQG